MLSNFDPGIQSPRENSVFSGECPLPPVKLILSHVDCSFKETLVQFQGQYQTISELDYDILQVEIQEIKKTTVCVDVGELCLVEDVLSHHWFRGRVQGKCSNKFDVFLLDYGNVLTVSADCLASAPDELLMFPPKIVCGFFANVLPLGDNWDVLATKYFSSLIGTEIKGHVRAFLPHKVLILEVPAINKDLVKLELGKPVDGDTFLVLVEMITEVPLLQNTGSAPDVLNESLVRQEVFCNPSIVQGLENLLCLHGPKLSVGSKQRVRISSAVKKSVFSCQLESMLMELMEMSDKLSCFCEKDSKELCNKHVGNLGLLCAVKWMDDKWYRGIVQDLTVDSKVQVQFIDCGFHESLRDEDICRLPSDFFSVPFMAFHCALSCETDQNESIQKEQQELFKRGLLGGVLLIHIDHFDIEKNQYSVTLKSVEMDDHMEPQKISSLSTVMKSTLCKKEKNFSPSSCAVECTNKANVVDSSENLDCLSGIKENSTFSGFVEYVVNPSDFWLKTEERNCTFEDMMNKMEKHFSSIQLHEEILEHPVPGALCGAMYEKDMHYYRAIVTETAENSAQVFFLDFGNSQKVPYMFMKKLPLEFAAEPGFAIKCSLAHVVSAQDVWTVHENCFFKQAVLDKALLVHVIQKKKDRLIVELYERDADESINMLMVRENMAVLWKSKAIKCGQLFHEISNKEKYTKRKTYKREHTLRNNLRRKSVGRRILQNVTKVENVASATKELVKCAIAADSLQTQGSVRQTLFKQQVFQPGSELIVNCCCFSSPFDFWCQDQRKLNQLDDLMEEIQQYYQVHNDAFHPTELSCVLRRQEDGCWYRGCIVGTENDELMVTLVDFGMTVKRKESDLRAVKPEFCQLEIQAFRCSTYQLIDPCGRYSDMLSTEASDSLKAFFQESSQNLKCRICSVVTVNNILYNVVDVYTSEKSATELLMESLVKKENYSQKLLPSVKFFSYVFSMFNIQIGTKETVYVTHVCSPWQLYFQLERNGKMCEDLMSEVKKQSSDVQRDSCAPWNSKLCLAQYSDGQWYRGFTFPVQSSMHVNVLFVDYGNMEIVEKSNVRLIPRRALKLFCVPMQALRCRLFGVPEGRAFPEVKTWLEKCALNKQLQATVVAIEDDGSLLCELFNGNLHLNEKVRELMSTQEQKEVSRVKEFIIHYEKPDLCAGGSAVGGDIKESLKPKIKSEKGVSLCGSKYKRTQTDFFSYQKTVNNARAALKPWHRTALKHLQGKNECRHLKSQTSHVGLPNVSELPEYVIKPGFKGVGYVSHVNSVSSFYIQMEKDENSILGLVKELNSAEVKEQMQRIPGNVNTGDLIASKYDDGLLYRAFVVDVSDNRLKVEFIDYGNEAEVKKHRAFILTNAFLMQPRLSVHCCQEVSCVFGDDVSFRELVPDKRLMVEFIRRCGSQWNVIIQVLEEGLSSDQSLSLQNCSTDEVNGDILSNLQSSEREPGDGRVMLENTQMQHCTYTQDDNVSILDNNAIKSHLTQIESQQSACLNCVVQSKETEQGIPDRNTNTAKIDIDKSKQQRLQATESTALALSNLNIKDLNIPPQNITSGQIEDGRILSVLDNGNFYVRLIRNSDILALLAELLEEAVFKASLVTVVDVRKGFECLVKSSDGRWCRGVVRDVCIDNGKCSVFLLDHGTSEVVSVDSIRNLSKELKQIPVQAILCSWVALAKVSGEVYENLEGCNGAGHQRGAMELDIKITFLSYSECSQVWVVKLMTETCLSKPITDTVENTEYADHFSLGATTNQELNLDDCCLVPRLSLAPVKTDVAYSGLAVAIATPCEFFVILDKMLLTMDTVCTALAELPDDLISVPDAFLVPGACCLIRSEETKWCRGEIVQVDNSSVVVGLADYGHCARVAYVCRHELKRLPEALASIPKVTHLCALRAVKPVGSDHWSDEAIVFFQEYMDSSNLVIYFRQYVSETLWAVDVVSQGVSIAEALVRAGHATYIDGLFTRGLRQESSSAVNQSRRDLTTVHSDLGAEVTLSLLKSLQWPEEFKAQLVVDHSELLESTEQIREESQSGKTRLHGPERNEPVCSSREAMKCVQM